MKTKSFLAISFCFLLVTTACVPISELYVGKNIDSTQSVMLEKSQRVSGVWETFDITVNYNYSVSDEVLEISGVGEFSQHYQIVYDRIRHLRFYLLLLDEKGSILETVNILAAPTSTEDEFPFNKTHKLSEDMKGFSFVYSGSASEKDGAAYFENIPTK